VGCWQTIFAGKAAKQLAIINCVIEQRFIGHTSYEVLTPLCSHRAVSSCPVSRRICQRLQDLVQMFIGVICAAAGAFAAVRDFEEKANLE
jgi:hypothetical protein